ncbi:hypothetical protein IFM89_031864 [Coptis chinensis]|uniref:Uncharacterized protein n=1 Tax=Coptis chinensis TaxID=261450 RepID=A0A835H0P2_9MAGN|nr:hypothetical protein IFM89_031864 [Coptis chinensis]
MLKPIPRRQNPPNYVNLLTTPFDFDKTPQVVEGNNVVVGGGGDGDGHVDSIVGSYSLDEFCRRPKEEDTIAVMYTPLWREELRCFRPDLEREAEKTRKYDLEDMRKTRIIFYVESGKKADNGDTFETGTEDTPLVLEVVEGLNSRLHIRLLEMSRLTPCLGKFASSKTRERSKMFQKPPLPSPLVEIVLVQVSRTLSPLRRSLLEAWLSLQAQLMKLFVLPTVVQAQW